MNLHDSDVASGPLGLVLFETEASTVQEGHSALGIWMC